MAEPTSKKVVMKLKDMDKDMEDFAVSTVLSYLDKAKDSQELAGMIKNAFETEHGAPWHVIVGRNFSCNVSFEQSCYIYFYIGQMGICIFKTP